MLKNTTVIKEILFKDTLKAVNDKKEKKCVKSVDYTFLCKHKQKQTLPSKWEKYCTADVSLFLKVEMNRFYSASDSDIDVLKQVSGSKNTKKSTLS